MKARRIKDLDRVDRPRERLAFRGAKTLSEEELLAILLRTGYKGKNALALARDILVRYPGGKLKELSFQELSRIKGMGASRSASLLAALELGERLSQNGASSQPEIRTPEQALAQLGDLAEKKKEHFVALYLNVRNCLIHRELISVGTLSESLVHPREVFSPALEHSAASLIVAHNHPSGDPEPSPEDRQVTRRLARAGELLGIPLMDHLVVAARGTVSFKERGWLGG